MLYTTITNFNFNEVADYVGPLPDVLQREYGYKRTAKNVIKFYTNFIAAPCIYYVKKDNLFCFSFDPYLVVDFAKENNIELTDTYDNLLKINENVRCHIKQSIKKRYKYNLNYIENWSSVKLHEDGSFNVQQYYLKPFTLDLKTNFNAFKELFLKYKKMVYTLIDEKRFLPTLTGGLDTRSFTGLYRERVGELDGYFLQSVKQDGKNNIAQGLMEQKFAKIISNKIGLAQNHFEDLGDKITLSGFMNENANSYDNPNDPEYIYKFIQHGYDNTHQYINKLTIYMDDDYLKFKQENEIFRLVTLLVFAEDLIHVPFISGTSVFNQFLDGAQVVFIDDFQKAVDIIKYWKSKGIDFKKEFKLGE